VKGSGEKRVTDSLEGKGLILFDKVGYVSKKGLWIDWGGGECWR